MAIFLPKVVDFSYTVSQKNVENRRTGDKLQKIA
jgi:hypothetical protein